ncbi:hypothetical protein OG225_11115 [Nocardia sp. NBC_01377]|uniref:hypothetical protein n=1 Tax=Nocardia sp. NBC_01377 TaxID=2903595 RepID=UPI0032540931
MSTDCAIAPPRTGATDPRHGRAVLAIVLVSHLPVSGTTRVSHLLEHIRAGEVTSITDELRELAEITEADQKAWGRGDHYPGHTRSPTPTPNTRVVPGARASALGTPRTEYRSRHHTRRTP